MAETVCLHDLLDNGQRGLLALHRTGTQTGLPVESTVNEPS